MKKLFFILLILPIQACHNPLTLDSAYASNKEWLEVVSGKKDWEGKQYDMCYKFNLKFLPEDAKNRVANDRNCITRCCWLSDVDEVTLNLNEGLEQELKTKGVARKYTPEKITIKVKYSSLLELSTASAAPSGAIKRDGTVKLKYKEENDFAVLEAVSQTAMAKSESAAAAAYINQIRAAEAKAKDTAEVAALTAQYEQKQAVAYVKRFYGFDIDNYLYKLDLEQRKSGYVLISGDKEWHTKTVQDATLVTCTSKSKRGKSTTSLKDYPIACGQWLVTNNAQVRPYNALATQIAAK
ncbi:hypothetical protein AAIR98_000662 [Elusimicrobium simillimum]|uniref:hypothetical protein n=1 Tax=Elusimicrobium simillimum TaxID=3143438 RepID=UPI003C6FCD80